MIVRIALCNSLASGENCQCEFKSLNGDRGTFEVLPFDVAVGLSCKRVWKQSGSCDSGFTVVVIDNTDALAMALNSRQALDYIAPRFWIENKICCAVNM